MSSTAEQAPSTPFPMDLNDDETAAIQYLVNGKRGGELRDVPIAEIDRRIRIAKIKLGVGNRVALVLKALGKDLVKAPDIEIAGFANDEQCGVVAGMSENLSNAEIAAVVGVSESSIPKIVSSVRDDFHLPKSQLSVLAVAYKEGWIYRGLRLFPELRQSPARQSRPHAQYRPARQFSPSQVDARMQRDYLKDRILNRVPQGMLPEHREALEVQLKIRFGTSNKVRQSLLAIRQHFIHIRTPTVGDKPTPAAIRGITILGSNDAPTDELFLANRLSPEALRTVFLDAAKKMKLSGATLEFIAITLYQAKLLPELVNMTPNVPRDPGQSEAPASLGSPDGLGGR